MFANIIDIENRLWDIADGLRANTHLRASEYSVPVLGLIFLKFATEKFKKIDRELQATRPAGSRRELGALCLPLLPREDVPGSLHLEHG